MTVFTRLPVRLASMFALALVAFSPLPSEAGNSKAKYQVLYSFQGQPDGAEPYGGLTLDAGGTLYGTTEWGGSGSCSGGYDPGCGTIFAVNSKGQETVLHSFAGSPTDGESPDAPPARDSSGNLYGVTNFGGAYDRGTVFKLDTNGAETVLYSFCPGGSPCTDGAVPNSPLVLDANGSLYGTTFLGGASYYDGAVFKLAPDGTETVLYSFSGGGEGEGSSFGGVIFDAAGSLYGTTVYGGKYDLGTVFELTPHSDGTWTPTVLHSFKGTPDGAFPSGRLALDAKGDLYGTTQGGGEKGSRSCQRDGCGTVFRVTPTGKETVLYRFTGPGEGSSGFWPGGGVIRDPAGNLYGGAAAWDGGCGCGLIFELNKMGKLAVLHKFSPGAGGYGPTGTLVRDAAGNFYGTAQFGGQFGYGTVFKLTP